ncbi:MAG TPA: clostripain-related cysteine peptidase [Clostridia bacterium]|nr:clostripain-related cysteine peptidase [Clostridia bacterium]
MKKFTAVILSICMLAAILVGCGSAETPSAPEGAQASISSESSLIKSNSAGQNWSVFVYLCGTDLETNGGFATVNLQELIDAEQADNVKVLVQTGGTETWRNDVVDASQLGRYEISQSAGITLVDQQPLASMGSADTLGSYLQWGVQNYPADKYMCLIWNHGGGSVSGVAFDQLYDNDSLNLLELSQGISQAGVEFEIIGFDTCLMATLENAAALCPYGKYLVASEEIEPGTGWDFTAWLEYISSNPTADGLEVGKAICDSYFAKCESSGASEMATLSVIDLASVPQLAGAFDTMATELGEIVTVPEKYQPYAKAITKAENYGGNNDNEGYTNMVDLSDLVLQSGNAFTNSGAQVLAALDNAVKYKVNGAGKQRSGGLSLFVPLGVDYDILNQYAKTAAISGSYLRYFESIFEWKMPEGLEINLPVINNESIFVETVNTGDIAEITPLNPADFALTFHNELDVDGNYILAIDAGENAVQSVAYNLYFEDDSGESLLFLGADYDLNYDEESGLYWDNFRNVWPIINDQICSMLPVDWSDNYILYTVPITLNGVETNLRMSYDYTTSQYAVIGTWDGIDESGMSSKEIRKLETGDSIEFLFGASDFATGESYSFPFGGFTVDGDVIVEETTLFDGIFYYEYEITDTFGKVYTSDMAKIVSQNGEITIETLS